MVYFALSMRWDNRKIYGSTIRASPPRRTFLAASEWEDIGPGRKRERSKRWIVGITNEELIEALGPTNRVVIERVRALARVVETIDSPLRVDMGEAARVACHDETEILMAALDDLTRRRERHGHSERLRAVWAMQLLLRTNHLAGQALTTGDKWPCTWTNPISTAPGRMVCRGRRDEQLGLLVWRGGKERWPRAHERVAYWWSRRKERS